MLSKIILASVLVGLSLQQPNNFPTLNLRGDAWKFHPAAGSGLGDVTPMNPIADWGKG